MAARPLYLGTDVLQRARDAEFSQRAERDIWKLGFDQQAESDISGLSKLIEPPKLELQAAPEQEPLPIVVSDRPDALALQQQAQARQAQQQPAPTENMAAPQPAAGQPSAMPSQTAQEGVQQAQAAARRVGTPEGGVEQWSDLVDEASKAYGVPPAIIKGIMHIESSGNPGAVSSQGAMGLMQVMPFHYGEGEDGMDPRTSVLRGAKILADNYRRWGDWDRAAAAYFGAIDDQGNITGATDATGTNGTNYVRLFRDAAGLYGGVPDARQSLNAAPASSPAPGAAAPETAGVPPAPAASPPPSPWANEQNAGNGPLMLKENDETAPMGGGDAMLPGDGGYAPQTYEQPYNPDDGPREATPGSVGAQPLPQPAYADPTVSDPAYTQDPTAAPVVDPLDPSTFGPSALPASSAGPRFMQPQPTYRDPREGQGIIARSIDAIGQYLPSSPIVETKPGDAKMFMGEQPASIGTPWDKNDGLWQWRGRLAEGTADALARGLDQDPDQLLLNVTIGGVPIQMSVSELLENVTDPLLGAGFGVGDMVLDAAGKAVMRLVAPYAKGAARETIGRLLNAEPVQNAARAGLEAVREGADALGRGLQGVGREVAGQLMDLNPAMTPRIVPPTTARGIFSNAAPVDDTLARAVEATPSASMTPDGIAIDVARFQTPAQAGQQPLAGGVFYTPGDLANNLYRHHGGYGMGGEQGVQGQTILRNPLPVPSIAGGDIALDAIQGRGAGAAMQRELAQALQAPGWTGGDPPPPGSAEKLAAVLRKYGVEDADAAAERLVTNLPTAATVQVRAGELIVGEVARKAGHDSIVEVGPNGIREVFDLREATYPTPDGGFSLRPEFHPRMAGDAGPGIGRAMADGADNLPRPRMAENIPPEAVQAVNTPSASDIVEEVRRTGLTPPARVVEMIGERPDYLPGVAQVILDQRRKIVDGTMTPRDVAKAYYMTVASQGADAIKVSTVEANVPGFKIPEQFWAQQRAVDGSPLVRPEEAAAAWLFTPRGQQALDDIERGIFNAEAWADGAAVRRAFGDDRFHTTNIFGGRAPVDGRTKFNMTTLQAFTDQFNDLAQRVARGEAPLAMLDRFTKRLNGVREAKAPFILHALGFGESPTIDAVEINTWLTGVGDISRLKTKEAEFVRQVNTWLRDPRVGAALRERITEQFDEVRQLLPPETTADLPPEVFNHILHHWIWDRMKGIETTHEGFYNALRNAATPGVSPGPRGATIGTHLATDAGNALAGSMVGAIAPADTPEERLRNTALGAAGFPIAGRLMRRAGGALGMPGIGPNGRPSKPTVEVLQQELDGMRALIQRARADGNTDLEKRAIDRAWQLESALVDARNARLDLEPRITSDVGRRIEELPLTEQSASDFAGIGRERVSPSAAADLTPPSAVATDMSGRMNSAIPGFDPASAAAGGAAGAASEDENGDAGDPIRTLAGMGFAGVAGRMGRKPGHTFAFGAKPGERLEFRVKVVPLKDLITSHTDALSINRAFPSELQPRVRERTASKVQIDKIVQTFDPEQVLVDTHRVDSGPMIVGDGLVVESGNGRSIALRRLAKENPEAYAEYVQALREELPRYGLTEDALKGIDQPVLVRERVTPMTPEERARYAADANVGVQARMAPVEQAMQDAGRISDDAVARIVVGEDQTIDEALMAAENGGFRRAFMASVPESEWGELLTADGNLNPRGLARVKDALLAKTYQGSAGARLATAFVDSLDSGIKNVQHGIMGSLPTVARAEARIAAGEIAPDLSIANDMAVAADVYSRLRRRKTILKDYIAQSGMFEGRETTPFQDKILAYLDENSRSPKRIRAMLDEYARTVDGMAGSEQTDMFGLPIPQATKEEVLDGVLRRLGTDADQGADLGRVGSGSNVVEGTGPGASQLPDQTAGAAPSRAAGSGAEAAAGPQLTPDEQLAKFNRAQQAQAPAGAPSRPAPALLRDANLPPVADDLIPATGGEAGILAQQGAPQPVTRPGPVGDILPRTGGPEGTLAREGAPVPMARPTPIPRDVLPSTGGPEGVLRQPVAVEPQSGPTPLARPTPIPADAIPATGGPEIRLRVQEDRQAVEQLMADSAGARTYDETQRRQISDATARYAEDVRILSDRIAAERAAGNTPDRLMVERAAVASRLHATMLLAEGRRGAAVRAFREADRQAALLQRDPKRAVDQLHKRFGGQENAAAAADEYTRMVEDGATPVQLARFWAGIERGKITGADLFGLYRRFNMLSGPRTIEVNALSGALNLGYEVLSQAGGQVARGRGSEAAAEFAAPFKAMGRAFTNLAETMRYGVSVEQAARGDIPRTLSSRTDNRAAKGVLTAMELPDRFNAAVDQFYRTMTEDWAATTLANRRARADGLTPRSDGWADAVAKHLQDIRDAVDVLPEIKQMADHVTFSEEPGGIGRGLEEFRRRAPLVANVLFPFIRTPYNIASRAVDISPLGVVRTGIEAATGRGRGRENISRRVRDNALGVAAAYWAYDQAQQGNITGAGPDDPEKLAMLRATGWQPYSVKIGDQYWSYANFAPFSLALSLGAAAHEAKQYAKPGETDTLALLGDAATRTAKVVTDMTVLQGIGAVIKSIQDPDRYGGAWLTQFVGTLVPAGSLLNTVGQATDDTVRRAERDTFANQVFQGVQARIPGLRQQVPAAQDPLGRAVPNDQQGAGALNPFRPTQGRPDPAIQAFLDAGVDIGKPKDKLTVAPGVAPIELTPAEQRRWNELRGAILAQNVPNVAGSQRYQEAEKLARAKGLQTMLNAAAQAADKQLIAEIGGPEVTRRVRGAVEKRRAS